MAEGVPEVLERPATRKDGAIGLVGQPEAVPGLVVLQRGAHLVAQEIQVSGDGAPRDAELAHEVPAVGQAPGFRALAHHLDHAPDAVVLRAGAGLHFSRIFGIFFGAVPLDGTGCFFSLGGMVEQVYRGRKPKASPLWQCLSHHFDEFLEAYKERFQPRYGFLRPIIPEVVEKFLECGDLARGFARIRCDHCKEDRLLAFSCKGRWFCPSCHQKKVQLFGALLAESILSLVPHRQFGIPKMLRPYFRCDRDLLKDLCRVAHECLIEFLRTSLGLSEGVPGIVMAIDTFGEYLDFHPTCTRWWPTGCLRVRGSSTFLPTSATPHPFQEVARVDQEGVGGRPIAVPEVLTEIRIVSLIDEEDVIERILRHLGLWQEGVCVHCGTDPPGETTLDPWLDDPLGAFSAT